MRIGIIICFLALFLYYGRYERLFYTGLKKRYFHPSDRTPYISVVVAVRNEEHNIPYLLTTLLNQDYPENLYEVIIANDGSADRTVDIVTDFQKKFSNLRLINVAITDQIISRKKNALSQAINVAKGEIILTTDADCIVKHTWISGMVRYFGAGVGMVAGLSLPNVVSWKHSKFIEKYEYLDTLALFSAAAGAIGKGKVFSGSGQNLAYTHNAYNKVNGFEKISKYISGDDVLLMQLIRRAGYKIRFAFGNETHNHTRSQKSIAQFLNQRIRWASNERAQIKLNIEFYIFLLITFLLNLTIVLSLFVAPIFFLLFVFIKGTSEWFVIKKGVHRFKIEHTRLRFFPIWALLQPFYIIVVGIAGQFKLFKWNKKPLNSQK
jgi:cellulose synthase/poly-beta-1,6-N-acetylglucosamine synthase-like glycosyltransferase